MKSVPGPGPGKRSSNEEIETIHSGKRPRDPTYTRYDHPAPFDVDRYWRHQREQQGQQELQEQWVREQHQIHQQQQALANLQLHRQRSQPSVATPSTSPVSAVSYSPVAADADEFDEEDFRASSGEYYQINLLLHSLHRERTMRRKPRGSK